MSAWKFFFGAAVLAVAVGRPSFAQNPQATQGSPSSGSAAASESADQADAAEEEPVRVEDLLDLDIEQLGQIDVRPSGSRPAATPRATSVPSTTLDLADLSGMDASSTGQLLERAPSVTVRRTSALNLDPRVRGYHSEQLNATANGMTQRKTRIDIDSLFSQIDPGIVSGMTVIDGPYTSLWGPGFAFLIADLFPTQRYDSPELHSQTVFQHETNGRRLYWRESLWGGGQDWGFYASYGQRVGNDYRPGSSSFDFRVPSSYNQWDGYFALSKDLGDWSRIEFDYLRSEQNNVELPGVAYDINHSKTDQFNVRWVAQEDRDEPERAVLQYWYARTPYHGDSTREAKQRTVYRSFATDNLLGFPPPLDVFNIANVFIGGHLQSTGARGLLTFGEKDDALLTVGLDWRRYEQRHLERHLNGLGQPAFVDTPSIIFIPGVSEGPENFVGIPSSSQDDWGLFGNLNLWLTERWEVNVGGRGDLVRSSLQQGDEIVANDLYVTQIGTNAPTQGLGMGYLSSTFQATDAVSVEMGVGYGMRAPTLGELYSETPSTPILRFVSPALGNSELDPERNLQFDFGLRGQNERLRWSARAFHSTIRNYALPIPVFPLAGGADVNNLGRVLEIDGAIQPLRDTGIAVYQYANIDRATLYGGDASAEWQISDWWTALGALSYVKGTNHSPLTGLSNLGFPDPNFEPSDKSSEALPNIYPLHGTVGLRVAEPLENRWGLGLFSTMVMGQRYVAQNLGEVGTPGFTTFALRGHYRVNDHFTIRSSIENLFDRSYTEHGSLAIINPAGGVGFIKEPGITWIFGVEAQF